MPGATDFTRTDVDGDPGAHDRIALIPTFRQMALALAFGVLIDAFVVRSLLGR